MRDYQVAGLNWMASLHHNGINGILADEMGLGKTLQTISFLGHLKFRCDTSGPHLIVVPKSTLNNWEREVAKWVPGFNTLVLQGTKEERADMIKNKILHSDFDVLITSYEMCLREKSVLQKFAWEYIIIDEAHRIKNVDSLLSQIVRSFTSRGRLLITGTPLQNNLQELWALLNFILPDVFSSSEDFDAWFKGQGDSDEQQQQVVAQLHKVLRPFLLRRVKAEVEHSLLPKKEVNLYVGMSDMQKKWYKSLLEKDIDAVNGASGTGKKEGKTRLLNIVMQLRKCCNHPYLFDGAEPGPPYTTDEHLVYNSDKLRILDKLLSKMKQRGSRVLIFSQMSRVLDILEDYSLFRGYKYCRIDGGTDHDTRTESIDEYNKPGSDKFLFLLTTRAGGLGINLVSADIVVLFDSDWNPQADLQAMDRAHRIGQTKQVYVYRFITKDAIEERIIERAMQKLKLDQMVIQAGRTQPAASKAAQNKEDLLDMIQHGAGKIITSNESLTTTEDDIEKIIREGEERTVELNKKYEGMNLDALTNFQPELGTRSWEGQTYSGFKTGGPGGPGWIDLGKRQAKEVSYAVDQYFSNAMKGNQPPKDDKPKIPKAPKQIDLQPHQFYPPRLQELQEREMNMYRKENNLPPELKSTAVADGVKEEDVTDEQRQQAQEAIDQAVPLTDEEREEKAELADKVFTNWNKPELRKFLELSGRYGKTSYTVIAAEMDNKSEDDVQTYAKVFWNRYKEIPGWEGYMKKYDDEEKRRERLKQDKDLLFSKISTARYPLQKLDINYGQNKSKQYAEDEDRFLLVRLNHHGIERDDTYDLIKRDIGEWPDFRFNWFIKSRTPDELKKRCAQLLTCLHKDADGTFAMQLAKAAEGAGGKGGAGAATGVKKRKTEDVASRDGTPASTKGMLYQMLTCLSRRVVC